MLERRTVAQSQKLGWLLFARLLLALLSLALIAVTAGEDLKESRYYPAYFLLVAVCFADLLYLMIYRLYGAGESFKTVQIGLDLVFVTLLILLSGGTRSIFSFLYYAVVLAAANIISRRSAFFFASLATVLLAGVTIGYYLANKYNTPLPLVHQTWIEFANLNLNSVLAYLVVQGVALHIVGFLSGQLAVRAADVKALYGRILDDMSQGLVVADKDNTVLYMNREAARLLGLTFSSLIQGRKLENLIPSSKGSNFSKIIDSSMPSAAPLIFETTDEDIVAKNVEVRTTPLRNSRDKRLGTIILITDLALRKRLEESQKRVERLQEIEEMSAGLAHEIRNPLASIRGCTQELGKQSFPDATNSKLAEIVCRESDRLDKIVNDFLNLARMKPPVFSRTNIEKLVEEVVIMLRSRNDIGDVQIMNKVTDKSLMYCDPEQVKQVLLNLAINSLESLEGKGYISFSAVRCNVGNSKLKRANLLDPEIEGYVIEVKDNGCGIDNSNVNKVFTPFFTTKQHGTGVGLSIVYKIITEHNGLIDIESEPGKGTTIFLWLPLYPRTAFRERVETWMKT